MSVTDRLATIALVFVLGTGGIASGTAADIPQEPEAAGTLLLPGRLPWGASALPTGELIAPCEDQTLTILDGKAKVLASWRAPARIGGPVTVAPRSPLQLLAVPLVTGVIQVVAWDSQTRSLAAQFVLTGSGESASTAWGPSGTLFAGWKDGHITAVTSRNSVVWTADLGFAIHSILSDEGLGTYVFGSGQVVLVGPGGKVTDRWMIVGTPRGVLQTMAGDLLCWTETGLWRKGPDDKTFGLFDKSTRLLGVTVDRLDQLILTDPDRFRRFSPGGNLIADVELPSKALTAGVVDDRGRVLVGTTAGMEAWTYDGRFLGTLDPIQPTSPLLVSLGGLGIWGSSDWVVHVWSGFRLPAYGWPEEGGGPGKQYSARRPASVETRSRNWEGDPEFDYFFQLVASGEESKQREVLDRFDAEAKTQNLLNRWPFANVILLKIGQSGLTDLLHDPVRVSNNWPALRLRAYGLLAATAGPEDRDELMALLHREFDPLAAAQGALALAQSGWDGDGRLMKLLLELQGRMQDQAVVADKVVDAARSLWISNGRSTDPSLIPLVAAVYQGAYPRKVKLKAQQFFQDLMEAP